MMMTVDGFSIGDSSIGDSSIGDSSRLLLIVTECFHKGATKAE